jgi:enamine deaminase RidA (YjgF/YER057c/UK114 family)
VGVSERLADLGLSLPPATTAIGSYVPARVFGDLVFTAGHLAKRDGEVVRGRVGADLDVAAAQALAAAVALDLVASAAAAAGAVERLEGVVKLTGFLAAADGFTEHAAVLNGASDLLVDLFGEAGRHARSTVGVASLPLGAALEIEAIFRVS